MPVLEASPAEFALERSCRAREFLFRGARSLRRHLRSLDLFALSGVFRQPEIFVFSFRSSIRAKVMAREKEGHFYPTSYSIVT